MEQLSKSGSGNVPTGSHVVKSPTPWVKYAFGGAAVTAALGALVAWKRPDVYKGIFNKFPQGVQERAKQMFESAKGIPAKVKGVFKKTPKPTAPIVTGV